MPLAKHVESFTVESTQKKCKLGAILDSPSLPKEDLDYLNETLHVQTGDPRRISTISLTAALNAEGYKIGISTIERHRTKTCCCFMFVGEDK